MSDIEQAIDQVVSQSGRDQSQTQQSDTDGDLQLVFQNSVQGLELMQMDSKDDERDTNADSGMGSASNDLFVRIQGISSLLIKNKELYEKKLNLITEYSDKIGEIGGEYENYNKINENDASKEQAHLLLKQKIDKLEKEAKKSVNVSVSTVSGVSASVPATSQNVNKNDWKLGVCGYPSKIINFGKTFSTEETCLARTGGDLPMYNKTGIYSIEWNIEQLSNYQRNNGIGICTDFYKNGYLHSREYWLQQSFHIGWDFGGEWHEKNAPNGLLCGWMNKDMNIFYKNHKFIGKPLPIVRRKDRVGLIYDSNDNVLYFKKNGVLLKSKLVLNIPLKYSKYGFYWFVGKENYKVKMSIISTNVNVDNS